MLLTRITGYVVVMPLALAICCATVSGQTAATSLQKPFTAWITSAGLDVGRNSPMEIVVLNEELTTKRYYLELSVDNLPNVIGRTEAQNLYISFLQKATTLIELPPQQMEVLVHEIRGYCSWSKFDVRLRWVEGQILLEERFIDSRDTRCMLNFEGIRRYEDTVKRGLSHLRSKTASESDSAMIRNSTSAKIRQYLQSLYENKAASVSVLSSNDHLLELVVSHMRKEVITDHPYWERLQLLLLFTNVESGTRITLVLDGKYGSGLAAPSLQGYSDMEPKYTSYLAEYGKSLMTKLTEAP